jgi:hypothetical protein
MGVENNFQRIGSVSNTHVGREFEEAARLFFATTGVSLQPGFAAPVGFKVKRSHKFDLGSEDPPILVECKSYTWTTGGNSPSAKIRGLNEVMLLFAVAPEHYRELTDRAGQPIRAETHLSQYVGGQTDIRKVTTANLIDEATTWGIQRRAASATVAETLDQVLAAIPATPGDTRVLAVIREQAERISLG